MFRTMLVLAWLFIVNVAVLSNSLSKKATGCAPGGSRNDRNHIKGQTHDNRYNLAMYVSLSSDYMNLGVLVFDTKLACLVKSRLTTTLFRKAKGASFTRCFGLRGGGMEEGNSHVVSSRDIAGDSTANIVGRSLKSDQLYGHSRSGETVVVEIVSAPQDDEKKNVKTWLESDLNTNGTNQIMDRQIVRSELQNIAKEFPSCAKYLLKELDQRRLV